MTSPFRALRELRGAPVETPAAQNRRVTPRFTKLLDVRVLDFDLETSNVSLGGMQVVCPKRWVGLLRRQWDPRRTPVEIMLQQGIRISAVCSVAYCCECEDDFLIGMRLEEMDDAARTHWQSYVTTLEQQIAAAAK